MEDDIRIFKSVGTKERPEVRMAWD